MKPEWIVVGDKARALIFARVPGAALPVLVEAIANPAALVDDQTGDDAASSFAHELAEHLEKSHRRERFGALSLILPPGMLERVRDRLRGATLRSLRRAIAEDLAPFETPLLMQRLEALRNESRRQEH